MDIGDKKMARLSFYDLYHESLDKLLTQSIFWFIERLDFVKKGHWDKAVQIEETYLDPLEIRINRLARIAKEEVKNGRY